MDENKSYEIFDDYVKFVCRKIMSIRKTNEVKEELYSHLFEEYDRNIALGMDNVSAQAKAVEKMGDKEITSNEFGALYSISPPDYMRSSLNFIIWGMFLSVFRIDIFQGMGEITQFIGEMCLLYGLFKLRHTEKKLNRALYLYIIIQFFGVVSQAVSLYTINFDNTIGSLVFLPLSLLLYWWIFSGINKLYTGYITEEDNKPHLYWGFASWVAFILNIYFAAFSEINEIAYISPIFIIFSLCQLRRAKKVLAHTEREFDLNRVLKKAEKTVYWVLVVILAILPIISMFSAARPKVETTVFNAQDVSASQTEISNAKSNMLELGFPEEYLNDLPNSEILRYSNATHLEYDIDEIYSSTMLSDRTHICNSEFFYFFFPDDEIRIMMRIAIIDEKSAIYRNGLYHQYYDKYFTPVFEETSKNYGTFFVALSEKGGKTLSTEPISEYTPNNYYEKNYIAGYEFAFINNSSNRRAYLAHSAKISEPTRPSLLPTDAVFIWQEIPLSTEKKSINEMAISEFDGVFTFGGSTIDTVRRWDLYNTFDYDPTYHINDEYINLDIVK